jgi:TP901 family phage tail tape measure protein
VSIQAAQLYALVSVAGAGQSVGDLQRVSGAVNAAQSTMGKLSANARQVGTGVRQVAGGLVRIGEWAATAIITAGAASSKIATTFQADMELIHTQAGALQSEVEAQTKAVQGLVHEVGTAPDVLAKGLYHIESVGVRGAKALDILRAGALGAKTGLADIEGTTNALTAVFYSGIGGINSMTQAMGFLDAIVGVGNMRLQDLVDSFGTGILGTAKTFGVGLRELGSALAVLTDAGVPARVAATRLSMTFTHLAAPTKAAIAVLKDLGLSQFDLANDLRKPNGVFAAFKDLHDHLLAVGEIKNGVLTPQGTADVTKLFGGSRFGATAMQLLGVFDRINTKYDAIGKGQQQFSDRVAKTMDTVKFRWDQFFADLQESALAFGEGINPSIARGLQHLDEFMVSHLGDIRKFGVDVDAAIDRIDWHGVEDGASQVVDLFKTAFGWIEKIPPKVDLMVAGFLGLNKLSGGLLGAGIGNIVGGLGKGVANLALAGLTKIPGVGGVIGAVTATRVFVTNWPIGFGGPGGVPVPGGGAGGNGFSVLPGLATKVLPFGATLPFLLAGDTPNTGATPMVQQLVDALRHDQSARTPGGQTYADLVTDLEKSMSADDIAAAMAQVSTNTVTAADAFARFTAQQALATAGVHNFAQTANAAANAAKAASGKPAWLVAWEKSINPGLRAPIKQAEIDLKLGKNVAAAARILGANVGTGGAGGGGLNIAQQTVAALEAARLKTNDPTTRTAISAAIRKIESRLPTLASNQANLRAAEKVAASSESQDKKLSDLNAILQDVNAHGDRLTRARVIALIAAVKAHKSRIVIQPGELLLRTTLFNPVTHAAQEKFALSTGRMTTRVDLFRGGPYRAGVPRVVGEEGPELEVPTGPGYVFNHEQTKALARVLSNVGGGLTTALGHVSNPTARAALERNLARARTHLSDLGDRLSAVHVDVAPQTIVFRINGREIATAQVMSSAFVRGTAGV